MILDSLHNSERYNVIHPRFADAFNFLKNTDFSQLEPGKIELDGCNLYATVALVDGKMPEDALLETHQQYIDIQMPLSSVESMGWSALNSLHSESAPYNQDHDITFFADNYSNLLNVNPGEFVVFFPEDAHAPCIGEGKIKKVILKILI